ncbi:MAG: LysR substrate-binding domain-containing protein [Paraglaciecola sp.]|uniref:LysR substrate-binding domain-containing protein n=1 Tax=Paraglaciecola TaxID=1621534 RepID=UPI00105CA363|nr:LysR substrate-binding domain-containing protein [Paraglaciecola marina]
MRGKLPTIISLQCFDAVAHHLNMTYAGNALHLTQSAVSRQVKNLEKLIGRELFYRQDNQLTLTPVGEQYAEEVHKMLNSLNAVTQKISSNTEYTKTVKLKVVTEPTFAIAWLMPKLNEFYTNYPDIEIDLGTDFESVARNTRRCDFAILWGDGDWPHYYAEPLRHDTYFAVCTPKYLRGRKPVKTMREVANFDFIHQSNAMSTTDEWFLKAGMTEKEISMIGGQYFDYFIYLLQAVKNNIGVSILPEYLVRDAIIEGELIVACEESFKPTQRFHILYDSERQDDYAIRQFRKWLLTHKDDM